MTKLCLSFGILLSLLTGASFAMEQKPKALWELWDEEETLGISKEDERLLAGKHVIFIAGFMNEVTSPLQNYFVDNIAEVKLLGGTSNVLRPSSKKSTKENTTAIYKLVIDIHNNIKKPIILFGHSKGGDATRRLIAEYPELIVNNIVERAIVIQGVMKGSYIADEASGFLYSIVEFVMKPNMLTLTHKDVEAEAGILLDNYEIKLKELSVLSNKEKQELENYIKSRACSVSSCITSRAPLSRGLKLVLGIMGNDLDKYKVAHDGLLTLDDQYDGTIFTEIGQVEADHLDLTVSFVSNISPSRRQAFTRAVFKRVYGLK